MSRIEMGLMTLEDVDAVHGIETLCFKTPWSRESFLREVTDNACARYMVLRVCGSCWMRGILRISPCIRTSAAWATAKRLRAG